MRRGSLALREQSAPTQVLNVVHVGLARLARRCDYRFANGVGSSVQSWLCSSPKIGSRTLAHDFFARRCAFLITEYQKERSNQRRTCNRRVNFIDKTLPLGDNLRNFGECLGPLRERREDGCWLCRGLGSHRGESRLRFRCRLWTRSSRGPNSRSIRRRWRRRSGSHQDRSRNGRGLW